MGLFSKIKDIATSTLVKTFVEHFISEFGDLNDIIINSEHKSIYLSVNLKGEKESITIEITGYEVVKSENGNFINLRNITASREWINIAFGKYYLDRRIQIPSQYIGIAKFLL